MNCWSISDERLANKTNQAVVMEVNSGALGLFITKSCAGYDVSKQLVYCSEAEFKRCFKPHAKILKSCSNIILCTVVSLSIHRF